MSVRQNGYFLSMLDKVEELFMKMKWEAEEEGYDEAILAIEEAERALENIY